ncbi:MAG: efflux RND transporter periplasmic adaptor subunit [Lachnospiraceae bacterium]|nr:efflux RND transporter periplasmic adaptor subunit [Lachnospiraceae bacterium]
MARKDKGINLNGDAAELSAQERLEKKKKKKRRKIVLTVIFSILGVLVLLIGIGVFAASRAMKKMAGSTVTLDYAQRGDIKSEITLSGTLESEKTMHYTAPATMKVAEAVPTGSYVKKGEVILKFDEQDYAKALKTLEYNKKIDENTYKSGKATMGDSGSKLAQAQADVRKYQAEVDKWQPIVDSYEKDERYDKDVKAVNTEIENQNKKIQEYTALISALDKKVSDYASTLDTDSLAMDEYDKKIEEYKINIDYYTQVADLSAKIKKCQDVIKNVGNQSDGWTKEYTDAKTKLTEAKANLESAKAKVESYKAGMGNGYDKDTNELRAELSAEQAQDAIDELKEYEKGLIAPFDGVVQLMSYTEGDTAAAGTPIVTFVSLDDVHVTLGVGKSDLEKLKEGQDVTIKMLKNEYKGKIRTINRAAVQAGNAGAQVAVTVSVDNPDDNIYLGLDAKCSILTASVTDVRMVPVEAVNIDGTGEFIFAFDKSTMMVHKKYVTTGTSSELFIEIVDGIEDDELIVTNYTGVLEDGKLATPSPESMIMLQQNK